MAVANNADEYAAARVNIFFPGEPANLTGQCVSLDKWYIGEMCGVADWQAARGNAKDFGDTLVKQGHATIVAEPRRGDIAVWKHDGGGYGHTGVVLSGSRVFEENVGIVGTRSKDVDGLTVFASRIDSLDAPWRVGAPTFYRMNGYHEVVPAPAPARGSNESGAKKGTATVLVKTLNVRSAPTTTSAVVARYSEGQKFNYDSWLVANGFVWLSYIGGSGSRRYVAEGPNDGNPNNVYVKTA